MKSADEISPLRVFLKALALFIVAAALFALANAAPLGRFSLYNHLFPGRARLPFGEDQQQAYNLSLYNVDSMFASHEVDAISRDDRTYMVFVLGDSSVWGTLLTPEQTLVGQLNAHAPTLCGRRARFYNLGYPTLSLTKDLLILDESMRYRPDRILWLATLESFPQENQLSAPLLANNPDRARELISRFHLDLDPHDPALVEPTAFSRTLIGQRRSLADLIRLQIYGVMWAATGIDQVYPPGYQRAQTDLKPDDTFHGRKPPTLDPRSLSFDTIEAGFQQAGGVPVLLVNEPILVSQGTNSDIRYNFFYPRWAYDQYRALLGARAQSEGWDYLDLWDLIPPDHFTNTAIHLDAEAEQTLASRVASALANSPCQ